MKSSHNITKFYESVTKISKFTENKFIYIKNHSPDGPEISWTNVILCMIKKIYIVNKNINVKTLL